MTDTAYQNPLPGLVQWIVKGQARHVLTAIAGGLAAHGVLPDQGAQTQFIQLGLSLVLFAAGCAWSAMEKKAVVASAADAVVQSRLNSGS